MSLARLHVWWTERTLRRKIRRMTYIPTFFANNIMLYEYKTEISSDWFLVMEGDELQTILPVNKEIIHTLVKDLNDTVGLSFVEFE